MRLAPLLWLMLLPLCPAQAASPRERIAVDLVVALDAGKGTEALTRLAREVRSATVDRALVGAGDEMHSEVGKLRRIRLSWAEGDKVKVVVEGERGDWLFSFRFDASQHVTHFSGSAPFSADPPYGCDGWDERRFKSGGAQALEMIPSTPAPHATVVIIDPLAGGRGGVDAARDLAIGLACRGVRTVRRLSGGIEPIRTALGVLRNSGEIAGASMLFVADSASSKMLDRLAQATDPVVLIGKIEAGERFRVVEKLFADRVLIGTGPEYLRSGHVSEDMVERIAIWARGER